MFSRPSPHRSLTIVIALFAIVVAAEWGLALTHRGASPLAAAVVAVALAGMLFGVFYRLSGPAD